MVCARGAGSKQADASLILRRPPKPCFHALLSAIDSSTPRGGQPAISSVRGAAFRGRRHTMNPIAASVLAGTLHGFFTDYLPRQRALSPHTLHSYRDSLKLFLRFVAGKQEDPNALAIEQLTSEQTLAFLEHLEVGRKNKAFTRNIRLSAKNSFLRLCDHQQCERHL